MAKEKAPSFPAAPEGFCPLLAPDDCDGCSFDGVEYAAADGFVVVPQAAVRALQDHGFVAPE